MLKLLANILTIIGMAASVVSSVLSPWIFMDEPSLPESMLDNKTVD